MTRVATRVGRQHQSAGWQARRAGDEPTSEDRRAKIEPTASIAPAPAEFLAVNELCWPLEISVRIQRHIDVTFLRNHAHATWACDFLPVTGLLFRPVHAFFVVALGSRRVVHVGVTRHPTDAWVAQQLREATRFEQRPRSLVRDRDSKYGSAFARVAAASSITELRTAYRAPRQNATCERFLGSVRRECPPAARAPRVRGVFQPRPAAPGDSAARPWRRGGIPGACWRCGHRAGVPGARWSPPRVPASRVAQTDRRSVQHTPFARRSASRPRLD